MKPLPSMSNNDPAASSVVKAYADTQAPHWSDGILLLVRISLYLAFVIVMTTSAFTSRAGPDSYFMFNAAKQLYITDDFAKIASRFDAVMYIYDVIATRSILDNTRQNHHVNPGMLRGEFGLSMGSLRGFSTLRLRQQKVRMGCTQYAQTRSFGPCFPPLTEATIDKSPFVGSVTNRTYKYTESKVSQKIRGRVPNMEYEAGGHVLYFDFNIMMMMMFANPNSTTGGFLTDEIAKTDAGFLSNDAAATIVRTGLTADLLADEWVNGSTRVLFADMSVMQSNGDFSIFASLNFIFEFPHSGGCIPSFQMLPFVLYPEMQVERKVVFAILCLLVFIEIVVQSCQLYRRRGSGPCVACGPIPSLVGTAWYSCMQCGTKYDRFKESFCPNEECGLPAQDWEHTCVVRGILLFGWNWILVINAMLCAVSESFFSSVRQDMFDSITAFMDWKAEYDRNARTGQLQTLPPYTEFAPLQITTASAFAMLALNVMISFMALYFFLRHIEIFGRFLRLFSAGATLLASFTLTFSVAFFGFAITMYLTLASQTENFQTLEGSVQGTFRLLLGDLSLNDLFSDAPWLIIIMYFFFGIMYIFIALNVFISIVTNAYEVAMERTPDDKDANGLRLLLRKVRGLDSTMSSLMEERRASRQPSEGDVVVETPNPLKAEFPQEADRLAQLEVDVARLNDHVKKQNDFIQARSFPPDQLAELARLIASELSKEAGFAQHQSPKAAVVVSSVNGSLSPRPFSETIGDRVWRESNLEGWSKQAKLDDEIIEPHIERPHFPL